MLVGIIAENGLPLIKQIEKDICNGEESITR